MCSMFLHDVCVYTSERGKTLAEVKVFNKSIVGGREGDYHHLD